MKLLPLYDDTDVAWNALRCAKVAPKAGHQLRLFPLKGCRQGNATTKRFFCLLAVSIATLTGCNKSDPKQRSTAEQKADIPVPSQAAPAREPDISVPPQAAPAWELRSVNGDLVKSADFEGKVVILDFWATWCPPCLREIPGLVELQKQYGAKGLVVVGISLDEGDTEAVKAFIKKLGINYPIVMGTPVVAAAFGGMEGVPTTYILDRKGNIVDKHVGYTPNSVFENTIKKLL